MAKEYERPQNEVPVTEKLYQCGTVGVWDGQKFISSIGCLKRFPFSSFDVHAQLCFSCSRSMCLEFGVSKENSGPLEAAVRHLHRYVDKLPGFGDISRREAIRMLVIASSGEVLEATEREWNGARKIVMRLPDMTEYWTDEAKAKMAAHGVK